MIRKYLPGLLVIAIVCLSNVACFALELSFTGALELMENQSLALEIARLNLEIAELEYKRAQAANLLVASQSSHLQALGSLERAHNTYHTAKKNNYLEILRKYTEVLASERTLAIRRLEETVAAHSYRVLQEKIRLGDAGRLDELKELNRYEAAERAVETAALNLAESMRTFKSLLSLAGEVDLKLTDDFVAREFNMALEDCLDLAMENNFDRKERNLSLQLQGLQLEKMKIDNTAPLDVKKAELNYTIAKLNQAKSQEDLLEKVTGSFHSLQQSWARFRSTERELTIAQESYTVSKKQADLGMITEIQLLEAQLSLLKTENSLREVVISYIINRIQFEQLIGLEVEDLG